MASYLADLFVIFNYTLLYIYHIVHSTLTVEYWKFHSEKLQPHCSCLPPNTHIHHPTFSTPTPLHPYPSTHTPLPMHTYTHNKHPLITHNS